MHTFFSHRFDARRRAALAAAAARLGALGAWPLLLAAAGCSSAREPAPQAEFVLLPGTRIGTADLRGKVTIVNFWATSCVTCVKEMPTLVDTWRKYQAQGFDLVAVAMSYDPPAYVANFTETRKLPFKVALDHQGQVAQAFGPVKVTPTSFLLDRQARIVKRWLGEPDLAKLHQDIEALLREPA